VHYSAELGAPLGDELGLLLGRRSGSHWEMHWERCWAMHWARRSDGWVQHWARQGQHWALTQGMSWVLQLRLAHLSATDSARSWEAAWRATRRRRQTTGHARGGRPTLGKSSG
jgi:hypothetical protein